jgi:mercuric ion transport protein
LADLLLKEGARAKTPETGVAVIGAAASVTALFSAAACCVLPLAFVGLGLGASGLAAFVPYHWPLTIVSAVAVSIGWLLYLRQRRALAGGSGCTSARANRQRLVLLCIATAAAATSAAWPHLIEKPLLALVGAPR